MDLNYLFSRHQLSLMRAANAASPEARHAHRGLARGYARLIDSMKHRTGAGFATPGLAA